MKLLSIFALIVAAMVDSTEALKLETEIEAPPQEEGINLGLAEVEGWHKKRGGSFAQISDMPPVNQSKAFSKADKADKAMTKA